MPNQSFTFVENMWSRRWFSSGRLFTLFITPHPIQLFAVVKYRINHHYSTGDSPLLSTLVSTQDTSVEYIFYTVSTAPITKTAI